MSLPQIFNFESSDVRTFNIDGEPWFVLMDTCSILGLRSSDVRQRLSDGVVSNHPIKDSLGRSTSATIINEDGLYDVILDSRKPEAKKFRKWITSEVIPSIRKHGAYMTPQTIEQAITSPDFLIQLANKIKDEQTKNKLLEEKIEQDKPKVHFAESVEISADSILIADLAKLLRQKGVDIGEHRLYRFMREEGYLIKSGSEYNKPTQRSMDLGIFEIKTGYRSGTGGVTKLTYTSKVTGKGQIYFINKFLKHSA